MQRATEFFSDQDRERINRAVQEAESKTSAEIVPVVATASGRYDRAEDMIGLWLAIVGLLVVWAIYPLPTAEPGDWAAPSPVLQLVALAVGVLLGFFVGAFLATQVAWLRRLATPQAQMQDQVFARARAAFFDNRVHHTAGGSGVLLYVSLFEHMAAVIADQSVLQKLGQDRVDQLCQEFTERLHDGRPADAFCETIRSVGLVLEPLLPRAEDDRNELADALVVID